MIYRNILKYVSIIFFGRIHYARSIGVTIGSNCRIYIDSWGTEPELVSIGNNVTIAADCTILTHDGSYILKKKIGSSRQYKILPVKIGSNVFVGTKSIILPGVCICDDVIIGAGSIVVKSILEPGVYVGNPVRKVKEFSKWKES